MPELKAGDGIELRSVPSTGELFIDNTGGGGASGPLLLQFQVGSADGATPITAGVKKARLIVPRAGSIVGWKMVADASTTASLSVWKDGSPDSEITGGARPGLTASSFASGTVLTGWTTALLENDILYFEVLSNDEATLISLTLEVE